MAKMDAGSSRLKLPKTRRDRFKENKRKQQIDTCNANAPTRSNNVSFVPGARKLTYDSAVPSEYALASGRDEQVDYCQVGAGQGRLFEGVSQLPLATNEDSWSHLAFRDGSTARTFRGSLDELDEDGEDVFPEGGAIEMDSAPPTRSDLYFPNRDPAQVCWTENVHRQSTYPQHDYRPTQTTDSSVQTHHKGASVLDICFCLFGIGSYLADIGSDIWLSYMYFKDKHYYWFALTLTFVLGPSLVMSTFSLILYIRDWRVTGEKASPPRWVSRFLFLILQLGPLLRLIDTMVFACRSRGHKNAEKRMELYEQMVDEGVDSALLRLLEAFMEAAPQLVLQLYIITQIGVSEGWFLVVVQCLGLCTSLITLASSLVSYHTSLRISQAPDKAKLRIPGMAIMFLWRLFTIAARVIALAIFASHFKYWVFVVVGVHWFLMLGWVIKQETDYCVIESRSGEMRHSRCLEFCFRVLAAFVHIFCFFNLLDGHTRLRCLLFYILMYVENVVLVIAWYIAASTLSSSSWYHVPVLVAVLGGFFVGIFFQLIYYLSCHPNNTSKSPAHQSRRIKCWISMKRLSIFEHKKHKPTSITTPFRGDTYEHFSVEDTGLLNESAPIVRSRDSSRKEMQGKRNEQYMLHPLGSSTPKRLPSKQEVNYDPSNIYRNSHDRDVLLTNTGGPSETAVKPVSPNNFLNNEHKSTKTAAKQKKKNQYSQPPGSEVSVSGQSCPASDKPHITDHEPESKVTAVASSSHIEKGTKRSPRDNNIKVPVCEDKSHTDVLPLEKNGRPGCHGDGQRKPSPDKTESPCSETNNAVAPSESQHRGSVSPSRECTGPETDNVILPRQSQQIGSVSPPRECIGRETNNVGLHRRSQQRGSVSPPRDSTHQTNNVVRTSRRPEQRDSVSPPRTLPCKTTVV